MILCTFLGVASFTVAIVALRLGLQHAVARRRELHGAQHVDDVAPWFIGGIDQAVQIRGADVRNPILLYVHGGPGFPAMPFAHAFQTAWEQHFTVVQWDQRNAGKTLAWNGVETGLTLDRYAKDGLELVEALQARYPARPIVLLGQSWGTAVAVEMLRHRPELFAAYLAMGQVSDFLAAERHGYETVLEEARKRNDRSIVEALSAHPNYPSGCSLSGASLGAVRAAEMKLGFGHRTDKRILLKLMGLAFMSPDYSWNDLRSLFSSKAQAASVDVALRELPLFIDKAAGFELSCPLIMIGGQYDLFTPTSMARAFFATIVAPHKEFIEVPDMAHFGAMEDPTLIAQIIIDKLLPLVGTQRAEQASPSNLKGKK